MATKDYQTSVNNDLTAVIANGQTTSGVIDLYGCALVGFIMPAAFTGTTITIQASDSPTGTFATVYNQGADVSITVAASKCVVFDNLHLVAGLRYVKLISGSAEGAERTIKLITRSL